MSLFKLISTHYRSTHFPTTRISTVFDTETTFSIISAEGEMASDKTYPTNVGFTHIDGGYTGVIADRIIKGAPSENRPSFNFCKEKVQRLLQSNRVDQYFFVETKKTAPIDWRNGAFSIWATLENADFMCLTYHMTPPLLFDKITGKPLSRHTTTLFKNVAIECHRYKLEHPTFVLFSTDEAQRYFPERREHLHDFSDGSAKELSAIMNLRIKIGRALQHPPTLSYIMNLKKLLSAFNKVIVSPKKESVASFISTQLSRATAHITQLEHKKASPEVIQNKVRSDLKFLFPHLNYLFPPQDSLMLILELEAPLDSSPKVTTPPSGKRQRRT